LHAVTSPVYTANHEKCCERDESSRFIKGRRNFGGNSLKVSGTENSTLNEHKHEQFELPIRYGETCRRCSYGRTPGPDHTDNILQKNNQDARNQARQRLPNTPDIAPGRVLQLSSNTLISACRSAAMRLPWLSGYCQNQNGIPIRIARAYYQPKGTVRGAISPA